MWWESKGLSGESIITPATSENNFVPNFTYIHNSKITIKFEGNCFKQDKVSFTQRIVENFFY